MAVLGNLRYIQDHLEGPPDRYSCKLQQVAWHNQSKTGADLIIDISNVRRHLPEGFSRCSMIVYSPSIIIELAELLYIQPAGRPRGLVTSGHEPATDPALFRSACYIMQLYQYHAKGISILLTGLVMAFEGAFRT